MEIFLMEFCFLFNLVSFLILLMILALESNVVSLLYCLRMEESFLVRIDM